MYEEHEQSEQQEDACDAPFLHAWVALGNEIRVVDELCGNFFQNAGLGVVDPQSRLLNSKTVGHGIGHSMQIFLKFRIRHTRSDTSDPLLDVGHFREHAGLEAYDVLVRNVVRGEGAAKCWEHTWNLTRLHKNFLQLRIAFDATVTSQMRLQCLNACISKEVFEQAIEMITNCEIQEPSHRPR